MMEGVALFLRQFFEPWLLFLADDPALRLLQCAMLLTGLCIIFLVFYTTRDILLRTHSFWYMFVSIVAVAGLPVAGFLLYLLFRPSRTIKEREMEEMLAELLSQSRASYATYPRGSTAVSAVRKPRSKKRRTADIQDELSL